MPVIIRLDQLIGEPKAIDQIRGWVSFFRLPNPLLDKLSRFG